MMKTNGNPHKKGLFGKIWNYFQNEKDEVSIIDFLFLKLFQHSVRIIWNLEFYEIREKI